jgi:hypothetical protein
MIPEVDTVFDVEDNNVISATASQLQFLAGSATLACMKLLNRGTWEILNTPLKVEICEEK